MLMAQGSILNSPVDPDDENAGASHWDTILATAPIFTIAFPLDIPKV